MTNPPGDGDRKPRRTRVEGRREASSRAERPGRAQGTGRAERPGRAQGTGRAERPGRAQGTGRGQSTSGGQAGGQSGTAGRAGRGGDPRDRDASRPKPAGDEQRRPRLREPELPAGIDASVLDRDVRGALRSFPAALAERIGAHLVAAGELLDDDPEQAHAHAWYARSLAPRLAVLREAAGITAYVTGDYAAALTELRAVRRLTGEAGHLPLMADCERGLGRPERALALARDPQVRTLDPATRVELAIVASGARRDRGEYDAAVVGLQGSALDDPRRHPWTTRLHYAYADALLAAGRTDEALRWFRSAAVADEEDETDAQERVEALEHPT